MTETITPMSTRSIGSAVPKAGSKARTEGVLKSNIMQNDIVTGDYATVRPSAATEPMALRAASNDENPDGAG